MRVNGIVVEKTRKFKATMDSDRTFNIAPNLLHRDMAAVGPRARHKQRVVTGPSIARKANARICLGSTQRDGRNGGG